MPASLAGDEVVGLPHREHDPEIQRDAGFLALGTGDGFHQIGNVRLSALVEFHVGMDRKAVEAFFADALPFAVRLDAARIDKKLTGFADGAADAAQPCRNLFW